ncbi:MAG: hypothetical protein AAFN92_17925 [Bacteroidota bacterium]
MDTTARTNPPKVNVVDNGYDKAAASRNYGVVLGGITALYLITVNLITGEVPTGTRFAKHLLIIPVVWIAIASYAAKIPSNKVFKKELGFLGRIAAWAAVTLGLINIGFFALLGTSFEQFMHEGETFAGAMVNSGFLIFETVVFVMIIGFVILQAYKGGGSPED